jgi:hypothetical protein
LGRFGIVCLGTPAAEKAIRSKQGIEGPAEGALMNKKLLGAMLSAFCLSLVVACKPQERLKPDVSAETAEVEGKIQKFKAAPNRENMEEADRALANMNAKMKELEAREPRVGGAEKDKTVGKLSACALSTTSTRSRSHP